MNSPLSSHGKVSGPVLVFTLFGLAFLAFAIIFSVAYLQKISDQKLLASENGREVLDSAMTPDSVRTWLRRLPSEWVRVTAVEGQGYVLYIPCYTHNATLNFKIHADGLPKIICEYCDSLNEIIIPAIVRLRNDSSWNFQIAAQAGHFQMLPVTDSLLSHFPEAPFKDSILLWTRTAENGRIDSLLFVAKSQEGEFEVVKAEDENPEGCGTDPED